MSSEDKARTELSYASARGNEYVAPLVENPIVKILSDILNYTPFFFSFFL